MWPSGLQPRNLQAAEGEFWRIRPEKLETRPFAAVSDEKKFP
jgi:hypothetical protein